MNNLQRNLSFLRVTLAAGQILPQYVTGAKLWVVESDGELMVKVGDRSEIPLNLGLAVEQDFASLTFRNAGTRTVTMDLYYGTAELTDQRFNVVTTRPNQFVVFADAQTFLATTDARTSGAAPYPTSIAHLGYCLLSANRLLPGSASQTSIRRRCAFITNNDPLAALEVRATVPTNWQSSLVTTTNGNLVALVFPKTTLTLQVDDDLAIVNNSGAAIACVLSESFYQY